MEKNKVQIRKKISNRCQIIESKHYRELVKLGMTIRKHRKIYKKSGEEFGKELGITRQKLQNLEEGIPNIPLYDYLKALDLLGLNYEIKITQKEPKD